MGGAAGERWEATQGELAEREEVLGGESGGAVGGIMGEAAAAGIAGDAAAGGARGSEGEEPAGESE